jgi:hypothetical protein
MNTTFLESFEAELAPVERVVEVQTTAPGWGCDLSCTDDLTADCVELDGNDPVVVAQYTYRRLNTDGDAGELPGDPDWGIDLRKKLSKGMTIRELDDIRNTIRAEIARDDRLQNIAVDPTYSIATESLDVSLSAEIVDSDNVFNLTMVVDASGSNLVELAVNGRPVPTTG